MIAKKINRCTQAVIISLVSTAAFLSTGAAEPENSRDAVRVLVVTGVDYADHHWQETSRVIRNILEADKRFEVQIVEDPDFLASPAVENYDVIILHFKNYKPLAHEAEVRQNLVNLIKQGKGLVILHFASGAFEDWPGYAALAGKVWDRRTTHDPRGEFTVHITAQKHPITDGMRDFQTDDELYTCLVGDRPVNVLAVSRSKVTGKDHPMAFVFEYGRGRVFHTPLGHDLRAIKMSGAAELIRRGCLWAAGERKQNMAAAK